MVAVEVQVLIVQRSIHYMVLAFSPVTWSLICLLVNPSLAILASLHSAKLFLPSACLCQSEARKGQPTHVDDII